MNRYWRLRSWRYDLGMIEILKAVRINWRRP